MRLVYVAYHGSIHTRRWVRYFAEAGHDVHVVTCGGADAIDHGLDGAVLPRPWRVHDLGSPRFGKLGYLLKLRRARRVIRQLNPDVVHAHWATSYGLLALASGIDPLVVTAHGDDLLIAPRNPVLRRIVRRVLTRARLITVPSQQMRRAAQELLGDDEREIAVFQYGVDTPELARLGGDRRERRQGPLRIVSARALLQLYRIDVLIDALALLHDRGVEFSAELLGDGPERAALEAQVHRLGLDGQVRFCGSIPAHEVPARVADADIYVSVSESDGVSLALLEAMALGVVPVLSDIPANRDWINDGRTGVLVDIEAESIAAGIQRATRLAPSEVARDNRAIVGERADRETNLRACELLIDSLVGVEWDPRPVSDTDAA